MRHPLPAAGSTSTSAPPSTTHGYVIPYDGATEHVSAEGACTIP